MPCRCLCVTRWKDAFLARDKLGDQVVPKVLLEATHADTLVSYLEVSRIMTSLLQIIIH